MAEETPSTQPAPEPTHEPKKEEAEKEETEKEKPAEKEKPPKKEVAPKKKGGWFQKIPTDVLLSPGGMVLFFLALLIEIIDWIPLPVIDQIIELPLEIMFIVLLAIIAKTSFKSLIIPFIIERIPIISDILPTWLIRMFM